METQVRTPSFIFTQPQRLVIPLFQRPYVWSKELQWAPLWDDVARVAERVISDPASRAQPHFLGAVVIQQLAKPVGSLQERTVIDGQQRLTTLQLMIDAIRRQLAELGQDQPADRLESLVTNPAPYCEKAEDRFKVWPTSRDQRSFASAMNPEGAKLDRNTPDSTDRLGEAHRFFSQAAKEWLTAEGQDQLQSRATAIEATVREQLQLVVIDLAADENAQEIFETLNARGSQLTAADLIKNYVFQRLLEDNEDVEKNYTDHWEQFETAFWEKELSYGRVLYSRVSVFLNHWLVAQTGEEIAAKSVFSRFKRFAEDSPFAMAELLPRISHAANTYRRIIDEAENPNAALDRLGLFTYRTGTLESEVFKPVIMLLVDPEETLIPDEQLTRAVESLESWLVRRTLIGATSKSYSQLAAEIVRHLRPQDRSQYGTLLQKYLAAQTGPGRYWPDNSEVRDRLHSLLAYKRVRRPRLRMVLEAIEDHFRGWKGTEASFGGQRVPRGSYAIEHVMPRAWQTNWELPESISELQRDRIVHTLGNLTLLTGKLNSKVSNGSWTTKRPALEKHDVLFLNRTLLKEAPDEWDERRINRRTSTMVETVLKIWPTPPGHTITLDNPIPSLQSKIELVDLISSGHLQPGMKLYARRKDLTDKYVTLMSDGRLDYEGRLYNSPSAAAKAITSLSTNGWWFLLSDRVNRTSLKEVLQEYRDDFGEESSEDGSEDEVEDLENGD